MTGVFDYILTVCRIMQSEPDNEMEESLREVFLYCANRVVEDYYRLPAWVKREYINEEWPIEMNFEDWEEYFSDVHDLDHKTMHKAFSKQCYIILEELEEMLGHPERLLSLQFSSRLRLLFRESKAAKKWFVETHEHLGRGLWRRKDEDKS